MKHKSIVMDENGERINGYLDHECGILQIEAVYVPPCIVEIGRENDTILNMHLQGEMHIIRLLLCGAIEVSINHGPWTEYLTFPLKDQQRKNSQTSE